MVRALRLWTENAVFITAVLVCVLPPGAGLGILRSVLGVNVINLIVLIIKTWSSSGLGRRNIRLVYPCGGGAPARCSMTGGSSYSAVAWTTSSILTAASIIPGKHAVDVLTVVSPYYLRRLKPRALI